MCELIDKIIDKLINILDNIRVRREFGEFLMMELLDLDTFI